MMNLLLRRSIRSEISEVNVLFLIGLLFIFYLVV